ncbi:hypothetical protein SDJN03_16900, partial [Cucurbita argyrosperma subsp. sororia]
MTIASAAMSPHGGFRTTPSGDCQLCRKSCTFSWALSDRVPNSQIHDAVLVFPKRAGRRTSCPLTTQPHCKPPPLRGSTKHSSPVVSQKGGFHCRHLQGKRLEASITLALLPQLERTHLLERVGYHRGQPLGPCDITYSVGRDDPRPLVASAQRRLGRSQTCGNGHATMLLCTRS